jgi:nucleoside-diphosphate-sugar epimerase
MRVLVTGASGFVGGAVVRRLAADVDVVVRAAVRQPSPGFAAPVEVATVPGLALTDWRDALASVDAVVHAAARVHLMHDVSSDPLADFRRVNVEGTRALALAAARAGVRRFVFISSIKVNGEETESGHPYTALDTPRPVDAYGVSKAEAESALRQIAEDSGMEAVVIRPVLVYGPGVKANFRAMMRWVHRGVPLPLGAIHNQRSLVALDNLVDLVDRTLTHPGAANQTFLVSDGEDLSTTELLRRTATAMGRRARLVPVPVPLLETAARAVGRGSLARRLFGSLTVDMKRTRQQLDWSPPLDVDSALEKTVSHYLAHEPR